MRERLYITTAPNEWDELYCKKQSAKFKNVIMYSPVNKAVFLNNIRYGSINDISDINEAELFTIDIDTFNLIHLYQNDPKEALGRLFEYRGRTIKNNDKIKCHVGERIQIQSNVPVNIINNTQYHWTSSDNNIVVIDGNNIITPKKVSDNHKVTLVNVNNPDDILFTINLVIYPNNSIFSSVGDADNPYVQDHDYAIIDESHITPNDAANLTPRSIAIDITNDAIIIGH